MVKLSMLDRKETHLFLDYTSIVNRGGCKKEYSKTLIT